MLIKRVVDVGQAMEAFHLLSMVLLRYHQTQELKPISYVPLPNASRGYIMHPPPRNNGNQFAPPKGYVMAGQPLAPPVSTYCVLGWKPSEEAPHNSNHECGFSGQIQANRGYVTDSDGI
ncbi:hypothetical protein AAG570_012638 [Ranatra chinensis]|uniref:Uncharacterized protein n=1 Tax=Ranatra chinensis TaxID=642074 RepID=A0ABD0YGE1_9HEMI